jgi:hypothetical protein
MIGLRWEIQQKRQLLQRLRSIERRFPATLHRAVHRQALRLTAVIKTGIKQSAPGGLPLIPNAPLTIRSKGSSKPLIHHGDLLRSIGEQEVLGVQATYFVGVNRAARSRDGLRSLATIAEWMEDGTRAHLIPITLRMRGFFRHLGIELPREQQYFLHPGTPPRPFIAPALTYWQKDVDRLLQTDLLHHLGPEVASG